MREGVCGMTAILRVESLVKAFGRRRVVNEVSFEIQTGEIVGLLGPNGAGKTTSFRMATGQLIPDRGRVFFAGIDVTDWPMYQRARLGMGYLSQEPSIFRRLTVEQNILAVLEMLPRSRSLGRPLTRRERQQRTDALLAQFGLAHIRHTPSARASGGERRRLEIARCLACEPLMILLDEPFAAVDPLTKTDIQQIVRSLASTGISVLVTDHDVDRVLELADRIYLITDGQVRCQGTPAEIVRNRQAIEGYLGDRYLRHDYNALPPSTVFQSSNSPSIDRIDELLRQERIRRFVDGLMGDEEQFRASYWAIMNERENAIPILLEAMERRDPEMRRRAFAVLYRILGGQGTFDPQAPLAVRQEQIASLRAKLALLRQQLVEAA
jgi:lipopolysaccharide export system ATP-binding protein